MEAVSRMIETIGFDHTRANGKDWRSCPYTVRPLRRRPLLAPSRRAHLSPQSATEVFGPSSIGWRGSKNDSRKGAKTPRVRWWV